MDKPTALYYQTHAAEVAQRFAAAKSGVEPFFPLAFAAGMRVLDIGCGSGRDTDHLLGLGVDAYGVEPSDGLRAKAVELFPRLAGRLAPGELPGLGKPFGGEFDGVLCSAVLMHLPREQLFDAAFAIRDVLRDNGRLLLSIPRERPGLDAEHRDGEGRLFTPLNEEYLQLLFERLGFRLVGKWHTADGGKRPGVSWTTLLFHLQRAEALRPLDQIEGILNRDRKTATYKLALFRALSEIATTEYEQARWLEAGEVALPVDIVCERWLTYYWPIFASPRFIPQIHGEAPTCRMPVAFRPQLTDLIGLYAGAGGLSSFVIDYRSRTLRPEAQRAMAEAMKSIRNTVVKGPVTYAGGSLEGGRIFRYDGQRREIVLPADLWRELALMGHWIQDAVVLRWAELTTEISKKEVRPSEVIDLLLTTPIAERDVAAARAVYERMPGKECAWSGEPIRGKFDVDHIIPFALWHNNDLWNLVPALPTVNNSKRDKLPSRGLLARRQDYLVHCWEIMREVYQTRFDNEASRIIGTAKLDRSWQRTAISRVTEAIETTALQRGAERWEPPM